MKVGVNIEEDGVVVRTLEYDLGESDSVEQLAERVAADIDADLDDVLVDLGFDGVELKKEDRLGDVLKGDRRLRHRRVCIDLHFESESVTRRFSPNTRWRRVHRFGCRKFDVANDACANLELHEDDPKGPALNEAVEIGSFTGCKTVWLVKPGPEPNGGR